MKINPGETLDFVMHIKENKIMRVGVIDIGSNSVRLMVADYIGRFEYIHRDIITTRLGRGVSKRESN